MKYLTILSLFLLLFTGCSGSKRKEQVPNVSNCREVGAVDLEKRREQLLKGGGPLCGAEQDVWTEVPAGQWLNKPYAYGDFSSWGEADDRGNPEGEQFPAISRVVIKRSNILRHKYNLKLEESHVFYDGCINKIRLDYTSQDNLTMCEARALLVDITEGMLEELNRNPTVGGAFCHYPFLASDLEIYVDFPSFYGQLLDQLMVGGIMLDEGVSHYFAQDIRRPVNHIWHQHVEPYFKSRMFVLYEKEVEEEYQREHHPPPPRHLIKERLYDDGA